MSLRDVELGRHLTDSQIDLVLHEVAERVGHVSVRGIRQELRRRFGTGGGTDRVCRRVAQWHEHYSSAEAATLETRVERLTAELDASRRRAELAEFRDQTNQDRALMEIDQLRQGARAAAGLHKQLSASVERELKLHATVAELESRIRELEARALC